MSKIKGLLDDVASEALRLETENQELQERVSTYAGQGGTLNMERSWKSRYKNALEKANARLRENGLEPIAVRRRIKE